MADQSDAPAPRNIAVIIAHGVGEADPGYAAATLASTLTECVGLRRDEELRVLHLPDTNASSPSQDHTFPVFVSGGQLGSGQRITFAELYWADLTKVGPSRMDAILGLFRIIFESHHFVDAMLDRNKGSGLRMLRHLLLVASWMLRGPIIGFVITTSALFWASIYVLPKAVEVISEPVLFSLVSGVVFVTSLTLFVWSVRRRDETWYDPTAWTAFFAVTISLSFAVLYYWDIRIVSDCPSIPGRPPDCRQTYIDGIYYLLSFLWRAWGAIILVSFFVAIYMYLRWRKSERAPPVLTALGVVLLQFVLWTALLGTAAMPLIYRAEEIKGINALQLANPSLHTTATADPSAQRLINVVPWDPRKSEWIDRIAFGYGFNGFMILCILLIGLITQLRRYWLAKRSVRDDRVTATRMPRMVVGAWILGVLMFVTFFQVLYLALRIEPAEFVAPFRGLFAMFGIEIVELATKWKHSILAIGWVSTLSLPILASTRLGNFVHIARDLIDHQYSRRRASALTRVGKSGDAERWPRRARIQARLGTLLDVLLRNGQFDHVIFVMHSQGSVVAFDYLRDQADISDHLKGLKPDIVTFGSPLTHLYEYYFFEYGDLSNDIARFRNRIGRWINFYRVDDYIGTDVALGGETGVTNEQIGPGGHTDYWKENRLAEIIRDLTSSKPGGRLQPRTGS